MLKKELADLFLKMDPIPIVLLKSEWLAFSLQIRKIMTTYDYVQLLLYQEKYTHFDFGHTLL